MHVTRGFTIGVLLAATGGLLLAATQASVRGDYDPSPMLIPIGNIGDELQYASFERGKSTPATLDAGHPQIAFRAPPPGAARSTGPSPTPSPTGWDEPLLIGSQVQRLESVPDATGLAHETILVAMNRTGPGGATVVDFIDVETRKKIRTDWKSAPAASKGFETVVSNFMPGSPQLRGLEFQGRALRLGQDVSDLYQVPSWMQASTWDYVAHSVVEARVVVNGVDAYGIRTTITLIEKPLGGAPRASNLDALRLEFVEDMFVTANVPYPVLSHRSFTWINGPSVETYEELEALHEYRPGPTAIPWTEPEPSDRSSNVDAERSGSQMHPIDGTGSRLEYRLGAAIEDVESDPTLVRFQLWRDEHPGYRLIGAKLERTTNVDSTTRGMKWNLHFAVPLRPTSEADASEALVQQPGNLFTVSAERLTGSGALVRADGTAISGPNITWANFPSGPVSLGAAEAMWASQSSDDYADQRVNFVLWGHSISGVGQSKERYRTLHVGYHGPLDDAPSASSTLMLNTDTGNVFYLKEERPPIDCGCIRLDDPLGKPPAAPAPHLVFSGIQPPTVEEVAVTTSSTLAVFLALYFLPLLKFLGGQSLAVFPGYAKLRRDEILGNKVRENILLTIKAEPGIHASDLARRVEAGWGTIVYHLTVLERNKLVSSLVDGRHKRFFPIGIVDFSRRGQIAVLRNDRTKEIFRLIAEDPGIIQGAIASRVQLSVPAAIWHLRRLEDAGLVGRDKQGRKVHYFANKDDDIPVPYDERDAVEVV